MPQGNVAAGQVLDAVFVMDAIWDFNFHHALLDSVAKLVHWSVPVPVPVNDACMYV
jgi:hypothetical protein